MGRKVDRDPEGIKPVILIQSRLAFEMGLFLFRTVGGQQPMSGRAKSVLLHTAAFFIVHTEKKMKNHNSSRVTIVHYDESPDSVSVKAQPDQLIRLRYEDNERCNWYDGNL